MGKISTYQQAPMRSEVQLERIDQAGYLANRFSQTANAGADLAFRQKEAQDTAYVSARAIDLETRANQRMQEWQKQNEMNPLQKEEALQQMIQTDIEELSKESPSDDARASLQRMGDDVKRRMSSAGNRWASEQLVKNIGNEIDRSSQTLQLEAFRSSDPNKLQDLFKQHDTLLVAASQSLHPSAVRQINEVGKREIVSNLVQGMIDKDRLNDAKRLLDSKEYDEVLGADTATRAYQMIERKREQLQNRQQNLLALKDKDAWKFLNELGETKDLPTLNFAGDAKSIADSFTRREDFIRDKGKKHQMEIPFMSPGEVDDFTDGFLRMTPTDAARLMNNLQDKTSPRQRAQVGAQVFSKEPGLSAAFMIAGDDKNAAAGIVTGMSLLRKGPDGTGKPVNPPPVNDVETAFDEYVGPAIDHPGARLSARQAATALMVSNLFREGKSADTFSKDDFNTALRSVIGPVVEINGQKTASFRGAKGKWMEEDDLEDLVGSLKESDIERIQGDVPRTVSGESINWKNSRDRVKLKAVADGSYYVFTEQGITFDKDRKPFKLNLKAIAQGKAGGGKRVSGLMDRLEGAFGVK
jgi:hypothetical protein